MKREAYLQELSGYLKTLPKADYQDILRYFTELFDEAGPEGEDELIASLGEPREAARDIRGTLLEKKIDEADTHKKKIGVVWFALLAILAAPISLLLLLVFLLVLGAVLALFVGLLFALFGVSGAMLVTSLAFLWESLVHFQTTGILLFNIGGMLISLGLGILVFIGGFGLAKLLGRGIVLLARYLYRKVKKNG